MLNRIDGRVCFRRNVAKLQQIIALSLIETSYPAFFHFSRYVRIISYRLFGNYIIYTSVIIIYTTRYFRRNEEKER